MDKNISTIQIGGRPIGILTQPSKKVMNEIRLLKIKQTPFGAEPLREFIVRRVKYPVVMLLNRDVKGLKALIMLLKLIRDFRKLPEPDKANTWHPMSHRLIDLRDEFFSHQVTVNRNKALRAIWNFVIITYDADRYYRERIDWVVTRLLPWTIFEGEEKPRSEWWVG